MLNRNAMSFAVLLLAASAAYASEEIGFFGKKSGGWASKEDMASINAYQQDRAKQDALEVSSALAKLKSRQALMEGDAASGVAEASAPSQEQAKSESEKMGSAVVAYESSAGDIMKYPIPCNEDDGLYVVDFQKSPACDLTYPAKNVSGLEIQTPQPLTNMEIAQRAQRPHMTF